MMARVTKKAEAMAMGTDWIVVGRGGWIILCGEVVRGRGRGRERVLYRHPHTGLYAEDPRTEWGDLGGQAAAALSALDEEEVIRRAAGLKLAVWRWYGEGELAFDREQSVRRPLGAA